MDKWVIIDHFYTRARNPYKALHLLEFLALHRRLSFLHELLALGN